MSQKEKDQKALEAAQELHRRQELENDDETSEEDAARRDLRAFAIKRMDEHWLRGLRLLAQYDGNRDMALDAFLLAHGQGDMIGMHSPVEVAIKHFADPRKKAAVTKCIKIFQDCLNIPPMPGQRSEAGRKAMSDARKKQLKPKGTK
jgi:hypothetical protein